MKHLKITLIDMISKKEGSYAEMARTSLVLKDFFLDYQSTNIGSMLIDLKSSHVDIEDILC